MSNPWGWLLFASAFAAFPVIAFYIAATGAPYWIVACASFTIGMHLLALSARLNPWE